MTTLIQQRRGAGSRPDASPKAGSRRRSRNHDALWACVFIGPTAAGLLAFYIWPAIRTFYFSFTDWGAFGGSEWVGLDNYAELVQDPELLGALQNTFIYTAVALVGVPVAIVIAAALNQHGLRGVGFYRVLYFIPVVTMPAAVALVWRMLYNGEWGLINFALSKLGIVGPSWLSDGRTALYAIAVVGIWSALGTQIVLFLAGLQGIPSTLYEAAVLDGAGPIQQFRHVTLPMLSPTIFFVTVLALIGSLQVFDLVFVMLGRSNPAEQDVQTMVYLFYEAGFVDNERGYAAAIAFVLLAIIMALTAIQFRLQRRWVHYA